MALSLDGMAVLGRIAANHRVFADIKADAAKQARALVVKQLKAKSLDLEHLFAVKKAMGPKTFEHILDGLSDAEVKSLLGKLDKYDPALKTSTPSSRREHLRLLAARKVKPAPVPERVTKGAAKAKTKAKPRKTLALSSMKAKMKAKAKRRS